jgi:hypothetical protein
VLALKGEELGIGRVGVAPADVVPDGLGQLEMAPVVGVGDRELAKWPEVGLN